MALYDTNKNLIAGSRKTNIYRCNSFAEYEALPAAEKAKYDYVATPDETSVVITRGSDETLASMLNRLFSAIDASKMTKNSKLVYRNPSAQVKAILPLSYYAIDWSEMRFAGFLNSTSADGILTMFVKSASSSATRCTLDANGVTWLDLSDITWMDQLELIY